MKHLIFIALMALALSAGATDVGLLIPTLEVATDSSDSGRQVSADTAADSCGTDYEWQIKPYCDKIER